MTPLQQELFNPVKPLSPCQSEVMEALRWCVVASDTADIRRALAELELSQPLGDHVLGAVDVVRRGLVERVGSHYVRPGVTRTRWRRTG